jgi:branched-chain amino acid transport system substrate-binding protein
MRGEGRASRVQERKTKGNWVLGLFVIGLLLLARSPQAADPSNATAPFLRLRESVLVYTGPAEDLANTAEIRLGWFGPTNRQDPAYGDLWWTLNFALDLDYCPLPPACCPLPAPAPFRLLSRWAVDPWGTGVSQLTRMIYNEHPVALLGSIDSASTHLAEQVVAKANLPLLSPISTDKSTTLAGVSWMFSCAPSDDAIARVLVQDILDHVACLSNAPQTKLSPGDPKHPPTQNRNSIQTAPSRATATLALLTCTDHESRMAAREILRELSRRGCMPDFRFEMPPGTHDLDPQLRALKESPPAAILIVAGTEESARWVKAVHECFASEPGLMVFGSHTMARNRFLEQAGSFAEGARFPLLFVPDSSKATTTQFSDAYRAEFHQTPDYAAALTYDATRLLIAAAQRAGPNRVRLREALFELSPWPGIAGEIRFDGTGHNTRSNIVIGTVRNHEIIQADSRPAQQASLNP